MVIGVDGSRAFNPHKTGTENYSYHLLLNLSKIDQKNQYIVYLRSSSDPGRDWPDNFSFKTLNFPKAWTQIGLAIQTFKDGLDVLFVPAHTLPLIRRQNLKTVVTVHDLGSEYLPFMHQLKQRLYLSLMQKYQLKGASKIIAVSKATKDDLVNKIGIDTKKVTVIYEGFDKKLFRPEKGPVDLSRRRDFPCQNCRLDNFASDLLCSNKSSIYYNLFELQSDYFLFVGTVQPRKNLERVIRAFSRYCQNDKVKLVIAGSKGWLSQDIYQLPKELGIEDQVKFLGYVEDKDLPSLYSGAAALVFPSLFEGFGLPILEAQACGCPVLTANLSSMPEIASKAAMMVNPYSIDDIVEGMKRIRDESTRKRLIKLGFENIKRFSWEKCARQTLEALMSS